MTPAPAMASTSPSRTAGPPTPRRPKAGAPSAGRVVQTDQCGRVVATPVTPVCTLIPPTRCPRAAWTVSSYQHIGDRRTQEDRFVVVPSLLDPDGRTPCSFFGVFDGTVGDFASENVKELVIPKLNESPSWKAFRGVVGTRHSDQVVSASEEKLIEQAIRDTYRTVDDSLLCRCAKSAQHYATCTSVTALIVGDVLVVGHLGDSRIVLGKTGATGLVGEQLTTDHKPDLETERARIEQCGGLVERLQNHSSKPFLRGGDFLMRKALGEQPMQLQYSRAFGAKDLKIFGLSNIPDIKIIRMGRDSAYRHVNFVILASDGLWDVLSAQSAVQIAHDACEKDLNPAEELVKEVLTEQSRRKARADNITAVVVQFDQAKSRQSDL